MAMAEIGDSNARGKIKHLPSLDGGDIAPGTAFEDLC
jgi:hypothetical protein